jgi:hypothetical protein
MLNQKAALIYLADTGAVPQRPIIARIDADQGVLIRPDYALGMRHCDVSPFTHSLLLRVWITQGLETVVSADRWAQSD